MTPPPATNPEVVEHVVDVLRGLISLLSRFGETKKAEWLVTRLTVIASDSSSLEFISRSLSELHRIVLGMGGLMDVHLSSTPQTEADEANAELRRLADQLFELTR